ncbi:hypothetical protein Lal_00018606 [Lupinus albus]|uniref:Uncharacterized protein n=1 Tax=Lupinus albus TaxID=3870 RepID=A0A6A5PGB3_LUPAL|nr:hypothetical protein Lalb_Chr03g0037581 [Lupinus albus]KAF1896323.1 hypothetical protein Lal_00018606 [Lupinus albus]
MATHLGSCASGAPYRSTHLLAPEPTHPFLNLLHFPNHQKPPQLTTTRRCLRLRAEVSGSGGGGDSYLDMWKKSVERERKITHFKRIAEQVLNNDDGGGGDIPSVEELEKKTQDFQKLLEVPSDERDRIQRLQVVDRAAAAIAAARAILKESDEARSGGSDGGGKKGWNREEIGKRQNGTQTGSISVPQSNTQKNGGVPGPDFWSWAPPSQPPDSGIPSKSDSGLQLNTKSTVYSSLPNPIVEKERSPQFLSIPFESLLSQSKLNPSLPPLQSSLEVEKIEASAFIQESPSLEEEQSRGALSSAHAEEAAQALNKANESSPMGVNPDGSRWWKETGLEERPDGVICRWTMTRGVSTDKAFEWQEKFWEAADEFGYKELGSEKSGRDANGNVWREFWRESMRQENGLMYMEKTADKWGKNGNGDEWQEKWWEQYNASGQAEKWAHKWCSIDPSTPLEAGHAHVWHERWGETYDGFGSSIKYTDKWAERSEDGGWEKWGDKWDENFDLNGNGVKQGETWWEGKHGDRWNRTWGEQHNGSGWVHKYGKSSSGEHWDTHEKQDTWYERFPHYGFYHCYENSGQLREVPKPSEIQET